MATYCIGDLHGRYDLFVKMLEKIKFDPKVDHMYFLGDVLGGNDSGISILEYIMDNPNSNTLILGNHENNVLGNRNCYSFVFSNERIMFAMKKIAESYLSVFKEIRCLFFDLAFKKTQKQVLSTPEIKRWIKQGDSKRRSIFVDNLFELLEAIEYDEEKYKRIFFLFRSLENKRIKKTTIELLKMDIGKFNIIVDYLSNCSKKVSIVINERNFTLLHTIHDLIEKVPTKIHFPHADTNDAYYVFGHVPTPLIYKESMGWDLKTDNYPYNNRFVFDYRKILAYIDTENNRYYNLDTGSNPISALRLDDLSQYYIGCPSSRSDWKVPDDKFDVKNGYEIVNNAIFHCMNEKNTFGDYIEFSEGMSEKYSIVTIKENCYEYLIGVCKRKKKIFYIRVDWFDRHYCFEIANWYNGQTEKEIIEKVHNDFLNQRKSSVLKAQNDYLHGKIQ